MSIKVEAIEISEDTMVAILPPSTVLLTNRDFLIAGETVIVTKQIEGEITKVEVMYKVGVVKIEYE